MKKFILIMVVLLNAVISIPAMAQGNELIEDPILAAPKPDEFFKAEVTELLAEGKIDEDYDRQYYQSVRVRFLNGYKKGQEIDITTTNYFPGAAPQQRLEVGDKVVVSQTYGYDGTALFQITDRYRVEQLYIIAACFVFLALWLGRRRGASSLLGLSFGIAVLGWYIVPRILAGDNPFITTLLGSIIIVTVALYLAHGFNSKTTTALVSTSVTLAIAIGMTVVFVKFSKLFGLGSEEAYFLIAAQQTINLQGLLLGGIIIGTLGVLDDITTAQTAVVAELKHAKPDLSRRDLYKRALSVGHEHIASLVNTLVLAYAGASLPIFLLFTLNRTQPIWTILNSEFVAEEVVRTLVGSSALVLSVPIATLIAAWAVDRWPKKFKGTGEPTHIH
jgi:uncharacterized membrane protein